MLTTPFTAQSTPAEILEGSTSPAGGPDVMAGVAEWSVDPVLADRLWTLAESAIR
ncbi:hypothetical protein [Actinoplanes solisilvae]|uniref:hypothetical protein n=1 Tax=Actinoplanes solisilvae TaxID=2486853 RepID=UPI00196A5385|nr:hypothetical protein [Actinoplanes solisilvae]